MTDTTNPTNILQDIEEFKNKLYKENGKNTFFKKSQKLEMAKTISNNFDLSEIIKKSIYILPKGINELQNEIYIDYTVLKLFIYDDIYEKIIDTILELYNECIVKYGNYSVNLNLDGFTVSAAERHKNAVKLFSDKCFNNKDFNYSELFNKIRIINAPSIMDILIKMFKPFFVKNVIQHIEIYNKNESINIMKQLAINL